VIEGRMTHRGDGPGSSAPKGARARIVEAGHELGLMRAALNARQLAVLNAICGEGLGMFAAAKACGMGTPATRRALRGGLEAALGALKAATKAGGGSAIAQGLEEAYEAVARAGRGL